MGKHQVVKNKKAFFFDRDGVINKNVFYSDTNEFESPRAIEDIRIYHKTLEIMHHLQKLGYLIFIVSNQPSFAKGKISFLELQNVSNYIEYYLQKKSINITAFYYCYHHPEALIVECRKQCECRKPSPYFLNKAAEDYLVDLKSSWMIGDRDSDIECGLRAGCRTIQIKSDHPTNKAGFSHPQFKVERIEQIKEILNETTDR